MTKSGKTPRSLGPLQDGATIIVVGGGPGGMGCALTLKNRARQMGRRLRVVLFEGKVFAGETHFNQCVGVLSPPIEEILQEDMGIPFPHHLVRRKITGYVLHSARSALTLDSEDSPGLAVRRVQFDDYVTEQARLAGVEIVTCRVTDLEFSEDRVTVYNESGACDADVVVGAFGIDEGSSACFERSTDYRPPQYLSSIVTKMHPSAEDMARFGDRIHAFLPSSSEIEFGAITPKADHLTVNIAGASVNKGWMDYFRQLPEVRQTLPPLANPQRPGDLTYFKGRFPTTQARAYWGDRFVMVGDAAGLVRPFKGKGVNSALMTGRWAAETMLRTGISAQAWRAYRLECREITDDLPYGIAMRRLAGFVRRRGLLDFVIRVAEQNGALRLALFDSVSAHHSYRSVVRKLIRPREIPRLFTASVVALTHRKSTILPRSLGNMK